MKFNIRKSKQDFDIHIHTVFCGHEFITTDDILNYINKTDRGVVVTPHFELNEWDKDYDFNDKEIRDKQLLTLKELSKNNTKVILGGEFSVQTMEGFDGSKLLDDIQVKVLSYHDMFKFNKHYFNSDGSVDMETTLKHRVDTDWIYTGKYSVDDLLSKLEYCLKTFNISMLGHMERRIKYMLLDASTEADCEALLDGSLDLAKKHGVHVEINVAPKSSTLEEKLNLINKCKERGIKMVVGLDAHTNDHLYLKEDYYNYFIDRIGDDYLITLDELLNK